MTSPILLHAGFDGLDMAYRVTLPSDLHTALLRARAEAVEARRAVPLSYGGHTVLVNGHGGAGGYAFSVDTGVMGANWWFKEPGTRDPWGARVSSRALSLVTNDIEAVKAEHDQFLRDLGMTFTEIDCRLGRIDYAIDFLLPDFFIDPAHFVTHSKRSKSLNGEFATDYRGDTLNGIRIGKMPNAQVAIYDKRREALDKKKHFWWDVWREKAEGAGICLTKKSPIWRFEFRAGKNLLENVYKRKTWEAFAARPSLAFEKIATETRLAQPQSDMNRARWPSAEVWRECQAQLAKIEFNAGVGIDADAIKQALFAEYLDTIGRQTVGLIISQMAGYGLGIEDLTRMLEQVGLDVAKKLENQPLSENAYLGERTAATDTKYGR